MFDTLPRSALDIMDWEWDRFQPYAADLLTRPLTPDTIHQWLTDWSRWHDLLSERYNRLLVGVRQNTADAETERAFNHFVDDLQPRMRQAEQRLKQKLLASGIQPEGFAIPLRNMKAESATFREENLPLMAEHQKLGLAYDKIIAAHTLEWEGQFITTTSLVPLVQDAPREVKEQAWRLAAQRVLQDREAINANWVKLMDVRGQIARNAGLRDYREFAWRERLRFDYTPQDCESFHAAIEEVVVPAVRRLIYEPRRQQYGYDSLRPWDVSVDVMRTTELHGDHAGRPPLKPYDTIEELAEIGSSVFRRVDPAFGDYFDSLRRDDLLDLPNRVHKGPGAFCMTYPALGRPFVFMNAVGIHDNVQTLFHECGHAFHSIEASRQPYFQLRPGMFTIPMEFNEVASMAMELLASPYLTRDQGGFYADSRDAARAQIEHLQSLLIFWPYMAVVDAFQHWVYIHHQPASDPANCDTVWGELWDRFIQGVDWSGLDDEKVTGWQRKLHIHRYPFYYVEYGLAQLGAVLIWRNALRDQAGAVAAYRRALALGNSVTLPELYAAAGARLAFDAGTLREAVDLIEEQIEALEATLQ